MSNRVPLVNVSGRTKELPSGDGIPASGLFQKQSVATGDTLTVPAGYGMVTQNFVIDGDLVLDGDVVFL